jgi:hypothetical protein
MTLKKLSTIAAAVVLIGASQLSAFAQRPVARSPQPPQQTEEEQKAAKEFERKALALLDELIVESASLALPENRIYVQSRAAEMLWKFDEPRARALVREVMDQIVALSQESAARDGEQFYGQRRIVHRDHSYLRQRLISFLAGRDSKLALEFLRTTRAPQTPAARPIGAPDQEKHLEMQLAAQAAGNDLPLALQIAEESIEKDLNYQTLELWSAVQRKDPQAGARLAIQIVSKLKSADILSNYDKSGLAFNLLQRLKSLSEQAANQQRAATTSASTLQTNPANPVELQQAFREILEMVVSAALKLAPTNLIERAEAERARGLLAQLQTFEPDIEKHLPARIAAVRAKLAQFDKATNRPQPQQQFYEQFQLQMVNKSPQEIVALAAKAPAEMRDYVYQQAAQKADGLGDFETAKKIIRENIQNKQSADQYLAMMEYSQAERSANEGKYDEARSIFSKLRSDEDRASHLARWAATAANKGDLKVARQFIEEARGLLGDKMQTQMSVQAQVSIASAAAGFDAGISFAIAEAAIERLNRLAAAGMEIVVFDGGQEGETWIESGEMWRVNNTGIGQLLATLARKDFDRTAGLQRQWRPDEVRISMCLSFLESVFNTQFARYPAPLAPPPPVRRVIR